MPSRGQSRAKIREICNLSCAELRCELGGFPQREGSVESLRCKFQDIVPMCSRHGNHQIGVCSDRGGELSCRKARRVTTQLLEDRRGM